MKDLNYKIPENLIYGVSTKEDGNLSCKWGDSKEVEENRKRFLNKFGLSLDDCVMMDLEHKDKVEIVSTEDKGLAMHCGIDGKMADSLVTTDKGVYLFVLTADCLSVTFFDAQNKVLGLAHISRINAEKEFIKKVITSMQKEGAELDNLKVYVGPSIDKDSYIMNYFDDANRAKWGDYVIDLKEEKVALDLIGYNQKQLLEVGIKKENIFLSGVDTYTSPDYYSHYRSKRTGEPEQRFATIVGIKA